MSDEMVLGKNSIFSADQKETGCNANAVVIGGTGSGKTLSVWYPSLLRVENSSVVNIIKKREQSSAALVGHFQELGYDTEELNLVNPEEGTCCFDPLDYLRPDDYQGIKGFADLVVDNDPDRTGSVRSDPYWEEEASLLLASLIRKAFLSVPCAGFVDVMEQVNRLRFSESDFGIGTNLDAEFDRLRRNDPDDPAVSWWNSFRDLPDRTARCVLGTLRTRLGSLFTSDVLACMAAKPGINLRRLGQKKTALFIAISPVKPALHRFVNMILGQLIRTLFELGEEYPGGVLPVPVRIFADDFANGGPIAHFAEDISIFRSKGISIMMLLQSESQLSALYGEKGAVTILDNCDTYVYMGSMDLATARQVSLRLDAPLEEILNLPIGREIIFQRGKKPVVTQRYDIFSDPRYLALAPKKPSGSAGQKKERIARQDRYWDSRFRKKQAEKERIRNEVRKRAERGKNS